MSSYIQELIQARVLEMREEDPQGTFRCVCNALVTHSNVHNHMDGERHRSFIRNNSCASCLQIQPDSMCCPNCRCVLCFECGNYECCPCCREYIQVSRDILIRRANNLINHLRQTLVQLNR